MIRLLHASDLHFGPKHLAAPAAALAALALRARPDAIVLSGDFTQRAKPAQFRAAREYVDALAAPVVWVPGNHDVPLWRFWERLFSPFGAWRRHFSPELVRDLVAERLAIFGVNTAHAWTTKHGRLRTGDLDDLAARLSAAPAGAAKVVVAHHPVAPARLRGCPPSSTRQATVLRRIELGSTRTTRIGPCGGSGRARARPSTKNLRLSVGRGARRVVKRLPVPLQTLTPVASSKVYRIWPS